MEKEADLQETERRFEILAKSLGLPPIGFDLEKKKTLLAQNEQLMNSLSAATKKEEKKEDKKEDKKEEKRYRTLTLRRKKRASAESSTLR